MPTEMKLWRIDGSDLQEVNASGLESESLLEKLIAKDPSLLGLGLLVIGQQITTEFGGRIDLLALDQQGDVVIIELKKDRTPRNVVAQALDYATWVKRLGYTDLDSIAKNYLKKDLSSAFSELFEHPLPEGININHRILIIASGLDDSSERIVQYLAEDYQVNINAMFFGVFEDKHGKLLGRAWLMDPEDVQDRSTSRKQAPWSGYWFVHVGEGPCRNWDDNMKYNYIGAGQGPWASNLLKKLKPDDKIFAYMTGLGYVGHGVVVEPAKMIKEFIVEDSGKPLLEMPLEAQSASKNQDDPELSEWAVRVGWQTVFSRDDARYFKGLFANQNIVCKLRHQDTVDFLKREFKVEE